MALLNPIAIGKGHYQLQKNKQTSASRLQQPDPKRKQDTRVGALRQGRNRNQATFVNAEQPALLTLSRGKAAPRGAGLSKPSPRDSRIT